jgi:beta-glucanase (GH16 family)
MKKITPIFTLAFILSACMLASCSGVPNGQLPLVPFTGCGVTHLDNNWVCTWADEFEGENLNPDYWNVEIDGQGGGNQEAQYYRQENITVANGKLAITAKQESFMGRQYTSGRINSRYKVATKFGRVTFRAKMPAGRGTWAAIWMLPLFNRYGQWPNSGEIDILEYVGYDPGKVFSATHTRKFNHNNNPPFKNPSKSIAINEPENKYYEYEMRWLPGEIQMFVEGVNYGTYRYAPSFNQDVPHHHVFPFHEEFYFIINLAIGGNWGGIQGIDVEIFPTILEVDYIRLYQLDIARIDKLDPSAPNRLFNTLLKNTIHWDQGDDDIWVEKYNIFLDGKWHREVAINQATLTGLMVNQTYQVQIQSIDFAGRKSALSQPIDFTFLG